jgi:hypothetical protein
VHAAALLLHCLIACSLLWMKEKGAQFSVQMHLWPNIFFVLFSPYSQNKHYKKDLIFFSNRYREFKSGPVILVILRKYSN